MSDENRQVPCADPRLHRARRQLPDHPLRVALLDLLAEAGTVTSTEAAARLGHSSGLCSFHLRQLARHGLIEEAPHDGGRARPWRLRWAPPEEPDGPFALQPEERAAPVRGPRDMSDRLRLDHREQAPGEWQHEESFSAVVHLTPAETVELGASIRRLLDGYRDRDRGPAARPDGTEPVAVVARLFTLPGR
ncbi:winged helix-turn-helix domain-containing protein [Streptomyces sp. NPDC048211]|uniref:winged helix-turn-helix domain-containing protein n=1 Tax=Streptomyces sp. NPDC048211 TaxID=3365516 RepID=UPI0037166B4F